MLGYFVVVVVVVNLNSILNFIVLSAIQISSEMHIRTYIVFIYLQFQCLVSIYP